MSNLDIVERLTFLQDAIGIGKGEVIIGQIVVDLLDFAEDQCYADDIGACYLFPEFEEDKSAHRELREKMEFFYYCFQAKMEIDPSEVRHYLEEWIAGYKKTAEYASSWSGDGAIPLK